MEFGQAQTTHNLQIVYYTTIDNNFETVKLKQSDFWVEIVCLSPNLPLVFQALWGNALKGRRPEFKVSYLFPASFPIQVNANFR